MSVTVADDCGHDVRVAIIGVGGSRPSPARNEVSLQELIFEGATNALADAGVTRTDLDSVVLSASDLIDGRGIASMASAAAAGAYMKHETRTTNDGIYALALAALEIWAGRSRTVLVMCWNKMSETHWDMISPTQFEPFYERPLGMNDQLAQGLAATSMLLERPEAAAAAAMATARNLLNAGRDAVEEAAYRPAHADGAFGMVLTDCETAAQIGSPFAVLDDISWGAGAALANRATVHDGGLADVAARAYLTSGLSRLEDIDLIELSARWGHEEVSILDGLVKPLGGDAISLIEDGSTCREGQLPVNPSGGFGGPYLLQAAGLVAVGNVVRQLTGRAGRHQLRGVRRGVAHGQSGPAAQGNVVAVLSAGGNVK